MVVFGSACRTKRPLYVKVGGLHIGITRLCHCGWYHSGGLNLVDFFLVWA